MKDWREVARAVRVAYVSNIRRLAAATWDSRRVHATGVLESMGTVMVRLKGGTRIEATSASWCIPPEHWKPYALFYIGPIPVAQAKPENVIEVLP